jgi:SAM-dependent methyltransferase
MALDDCSLGRGRVGRWISRMVAVVSDRLHGSEAPSEWIQQMLDMHVGEASDAIDLACGSGRHARLLARKGLSVIAIDTNPTLADALESANIKFQQVDLELELWPLEGVEADVVVVSNYLYRPHLARVGDLVRVGGILIYETFGVGNEAFGKPSNPDFLLQDGELEVCFESRFDTLDLFFGSVSEPKPAVRGRYCGRRRV